MKTTRASALAVLAAGLLALPGVVGGQRGDTTVVTELDANQIVPCLLPARVRRLGGMTYPERRQLTRTTVRRCELRGGEYTAFDRARPESSVAFFEPMADDGDAAAQRSLGEVYEYLFDPPRYEEAAIWYRRAAAQDDATAKRRLAHLHENGLGVERNPLLATNLWRDATGTGEALVPASELEAARTAAQRRIDDLTTELATRTAEAESLRQALQADQQQLAERRAAQAEAEAALDRLRAAQEASRVAGDRDALAALERELEQRQRQLDDQAFEIATMESALTAQRANLVASVQRAALENERLERELARITARSDAELAETRAALADKSAELARLQQEQATLARRLDATAVEDDALAEAQQAAAAMAERVAAVERDATELQRRLDDAIDGRQRLEAELISAEARLAAAEQRLAAAETERVAMGQTLEQERKEREALRRSLARAEQERSANAAALAAELSTRDSRIAAQAARLAELEAQTDALRAEAETARGRWSMQLASRGAVDPLPDTSAIRVPRGVPVGRYHALVIGNNNYAHLSSLSFAHNDARAVHELLSTRYGFESQLVLDTTRAGLFAEFEALEARLRPEDALVIYYAGHGMEERRVSYWLGVDAPSTSASLPAYGLSSTELGQWLSVLPAKHVLVIADSCYSGAGIETTGGMKFNATDVEQQLAFYLQNRSRTTLSSGGNLPVPDGGAGEHSVFTRALLGLLEENRGVLFDADIYARLKERIRFGEHAVVGAPTPVFGRIEVGGHGAGQFVFIHPDVLSSRRAAATRLEGAAAVVRLSEHGTTR